MGDATTTLIGRLSEHYLNTAVLFVWHSFEGTVVFCTASAFWNCKMSSLLKALHTNFRFTFHMSTSLTSQARFHAPAVAPNFMAPQARYGRRSSPLPCMTIVAHSWSGSLEDPQVVARKLTQRINWFSRVLFSSPNSPICAYKPNSETTPFITSPIQYCVHSE